MVARSRRSAEAQCTCSLGLGYKLCALIPVAGQQTHKTTFLALKVTSQVATPRKSLCCMTALFAITFQCKRSYEKCSTIIAVPFVCHM